MEHKQNDFEHFDVIGRDAQIERWEQCARVLETMPEHERTQHWDMGTFGTHTACGTVACAAGHCGLDPWFRDRGFQLNFIKCSCGDPYCSVQRFSTPQLFFGDKGTERIFLNCKSRPVEAVLAEVREYIAELKATQS